MAPSSTCSGTAVNTTMDDSIFPDANSGCGVVSINIGRCSFWISIIITRCFWSTTASNASELTAFHGQITFSAIGVAFTRSADVERLRITSNRIIKLVLLEFSAFCNASKCTLSSINWGINASFAIITTNYRIFVSKSNFSIRWGDGKFIVIFSCPIIIGTKCHQSMESPTWLTFGSIFSSYNFNVTIIAAFKTDSRVTSINITPYGINLCGNCIVGSHSSTNAEIMAVGIDVIPTIIVIIILYVFEFEVIV